SPVATINVTARETVTISLPYRAGLQKRVYVREGPRWRRNTLAPETTVADIYTGLIVYSLPTTNSFPNADPAVFRSTNGNIVMRGDGSGNWGPLEFSPTGYVSGIAASGQHVITTPAANTVTSVEITLPPGRFDRPPNVTATAYSTSPQNVSIGVWPVTAESFVLNLYNVTDSTRRIAWQAVDGE